MNPLESMTRETFAQLIGQTFAILTRDGRIELSLAGAKILGHKRNEATRDPFSLTFRGIQGLRLPQGIYQLSNNDLGEFELFIAQVADGEKGSEFEAIFT
jgi:hypothetical protein